MLSINNALRRRQWFGSGILCLAVAQTSLAAIDPTLQMTFARTGQSLIVNWYGYGHVPYQVETSVDLKNWVNAGPAINANGGILSFTNAITGGGPAFVRVKRIFPAAPGSAVFDPATGLLTVVGDANHTNLNVANDGTGTIAVTSNAGPMPVTGGAPTTANTLLIQVLGSALGDQITIGNGLPAAHLFGADGNDTLTGGSGNDLIAGGPGSDTIKGGQGSDVIFLDGGDTFIWNPGDGSDIVDGSGGNNSIVFNGSNVGENITLSANGSRLRLFRDVASVTLDAGGVQTVKLSVLGGADNITVTNLVGTAVTRVEVDLGAPLGSTNGDGQADTVAISGTPGADTINVAANGSAVDVTGAGPLVHIVNAELANDRILITGAGGDLVNVNGTAGADTMQVTPSPMANCVRTTVSGFTVPVDVTGALTLSVNGLGGPDTITAGNGVAALAIPIVLDGGDGDDIITGSDSNDTIYGGSGNNTITGARGSDIAFLGIGTNTFVWNPGDGSDTVEGQGGNNTLQFNGSNVSENFNLSANGTRLRLTRDVASITMDVNGVQTVNITTLGGADNLVVNSLQGTDVKQVNIDLGATGGVGDGQPDTVTVNGTAGDDTISLTAVGGAVQVSGLAAQVLIAHPEMANDKLIINGLGGANSVTIGPGVTSLIGLQVN